MAATVTDLAELEATLEQPLTGGAQLAEKETVLQVTGFLLTCTVVVCLCCGLRHLLKLPYCCVACRIITVVTKSTQSALL